MTDPSLHRPSLRRRSASESDTDPMTSTNNPWIYLNRCIPPGQTESQPNVSGLGFVTETDRQLQARKINLESKAVGVWERFEGMKVEIKDLKTSESQFMFVDAINNQDYLLTKLFQDLAKEAVMAGVELTLCGRISNYKNVIIQIKEKILKRIETRSSSTSSPTNLSGNRAMQGELNIS